MLSHRKKAEEIAFSFFAIEYLKLFHETSSLSSLQRNFLNLSIKIFREFVSQTMIFGEENLGSPQTRIGSQLADAVVR